MKRLLILLVPLALAGCAAGEPDTEPRTVVTKTVTAAPSPDPTEAQVATAEADPFAPNVGDRSLQLGNARRGSAITTTLLEVRDPYPPQEYREAQPGRHYFGVRLSQCVLKDAERAGDLISTYNGEWYVKAQTGEQYQGSGSSYSDFPLPKFPETVTMNPGDCLKGWLLVEVPDSTSQPTTIIFRPAGQTVAEWNF